MAAYSFIRETIRGRHLGAAKVNALRELQSPALRYGDGSQSASGEL